MILQEAAITLFILSLAVGMNLELVRRAQYEVLFRHACFLYVRERSLGSGLAKSRHAVFTFLETALGYRKTRSVFIGLHLDEVRVAQGLEAKVHYRYPSLVQFLYQFRKNNGAELTFRKHHFELTETCRYFF